MAAAAAWFVWQSAGLGQHLAPPWEAQPEELKAIWQETRELCKKCSFGLKRVRGEPEFVKRVVESKKRIDRYTAAHEGKDLNWYWWGTAFNNAYKLALTQWPAGYPAAEKILREGLAVLEGARSDDALAVPHVKLELYESHVRGWVETHAAECSRVWDEVGEWVRGSGIGALVGWWHSTRSTVEPQLLVWASARLKDEAYAAHAAARLRVIAEFVADDSVEMRHRATALRCAVEHLAKRGEAGAAAGLVELVKPEKGVTPDYYYSRMLVALFGEGNWEKATSTLAAMQAAPAPDRPEKPSEQRMREKTFDLYYGNVFLPGPELLRRGGPEAEKER